MNAIWIILDSLSFDATPFAEGGPNTMPQLSALSKEEGICFTQAYAPGPTSPSSHSSFFTGELPSVTGMHEANPYFTEDIETIAHKLSDMERYAISSNPFIFNGLCDDFDIIDDLCTRGFVLFDDASDPITEGAQRYAESKFKKYMDFVFNNGKPVRSLLNGINYKLYRKRRDGDLPKDAPLDSEAHQYAKTMSKRIRQFQESTSSESFIVANFMDVHAPLDASEEALQKFASGYSRAELPIGIGGQQIHKKTQAGDTKIGERMYDLYKAAIWDLDRTVTPLIKEAVDNEAFVVVTADHGNWFQRETELDEQRIHVPLILFAPDEPARTVNKTVNLRSLPRTTMEVLYDTNGGFAGVDLTSIEKNCISVTELIHYPDAPGSPVQPFGRDDQAVQYDLAVIKGDSRVDMVNGEYRTLRDSGSTGELKEKIRELRSREIRFESVNEAADTTKEDRLRQLGYLE